MKNHSLSFGVFTLALLSCCLAQPDDSTAPETDPNAAAVEAAFKSNTLRLAENPAFLVRKGVLADQANRTVRILAQATGIKPNGSPPEFLLVSPRSSHDYESLMVSLAEPEDIHDALVFIGVPPGRCVNFRKNRIWPRGERVTITLSSDHPACPLKNEPIESLVVDERTRQPIPQSDFLFTGSARVEAPDNPGKKIYAASAQEPGSIVSTYNEPETVFDVPRFAPQAEVYGSLAVSSNKTLATNQLIEITFRPTDPAGFLRPVDFKLTATPPTNATAYPAEQVLFSLTTTNATQLAATNLAAVLTALDNVTAQNHDPFVTLDFSPKLTLSVMREICSQIASAERTKGIRIEPPLEGHFYYKAYLPNPSFRDRAKRNAQPWELTVKRTNSTFISTLVKIHEEWIDGQAQPKISTTEQVVSDGKALKEKLAELGPGLPVILIFADSSLTCGEISALVAPVLDSHDTIYVFPE